MIKDLIGQSLVKGLQKFLLNKLNKKQDMELGVLDKMINNKKILNNME